MPTALVSGADRGLGLALTKRLLELGWQVIAGRYMTDWHELPELASQYKDNAFVIPLDISSDKSVYSAAKLAEAMTDAIDLVIHNAAVSTRLNDIGITDGLDYKDMKRIYNVNTIGMLRVTEAFMNLTDAGHMKTQCIISSEAGSIERCERKAWYGYCMSKAALNMGALRMYEQLRPDGYIFKLFHPGWMKTYMSGVKNDAAELEADEVAEAALNYFMATEDAGKPLVMRDWQGKEWPW